jgi:multidrug efflux system outer membrane protein
VTAPSLTVRLGCARPFAILLLTLHGCSVGPAYRAPAQPTPSTDGTQWPTSDWWRSFGSTQLDDFMEQANRGNDDIAAAIARVRQADAQIRIAGAPLLPTVGLGASASRQRSFGTNGARTPIYNEYTPQLTASYELDFWGKNRAIRAAAVAAAQASRYDRDTIALSVYTSVALTYFERWKRTIVSWSRRMITGQRATHSRWAGAGTKGRHRDRAGCRAAGHDGRHRQCVIPALRAAAATEHRCAGDSDRPVAAERERRNRQQSGSIDAAAGHRRYALELLARRPDVAEAEAQLRRPTPTSWPRVRRTFPASI